MRRLCWVDCRCEDVQVGAPELAGRVSSAPLLPSHGREGAGGGGSREGSSKGLGRSASFARGQLGAAISTGGGGVLQCESRERRQRTDRPTQHAGARFPAKTQKQTNMNMRCSDPEELETESGVCPFRVGLFARPTFGSANDCAMIGRQWCVSFAAGWATRKGGAALLLLCA